MLFDLFFLLLHGNIYVSYCMKKKVYMLLAGATLAAAFTGCKSSEKGYEAAYERAQQAATEEVVQEETVEVNPVISVPVDEVRVEDNVDNVPVKRENVSVVDGAGLKAYSVVVGSFSVLANAQGRQQVLKNQGYQAQIVRNQEGYTYRVIASTFDRKADAVASRDALRSTYSDAWLLYSQK